MNMNDYYSGGWLKASDLQGKRVQVTIADIDEFTNQEGKTQPTLSFKGKEKKLGLNKVNATTIAALVGSYEMDDWIGHTIELYPTKTEFAGKRVDCIRVDEQFHEAPKGAKAAAAPSGRSERFDDEDDEVPF
jgi:hypothetical protein